jgi:DNA-binding IclR family transcriptional regulator
MGVREVARKLELSPAIVQRLMNTLAADGFVVRDNRTRKYALGFSALTLGSSMMRDNQLLSASAAELTRLSDAVEANSFLCVPTGNRLTYVLAIQSPGPVSINSAPGSTAAFHSTAVGKALLAEMTAEQVEQTLGSKPLEQFTPATITDRKVLQEQLEDVRRRGYATTADENLPGVCAVGAVVRASDGKPVAAASIAYAPSVQPQIVLPDLVRQVVQTTRTISSRLGYPDAALGEFRLLNDVA